MKNSIEEEKTPWLHPVGISETFKSPIFGDTRHGSESERAMIAMAVAETPVTVFQELSKRFNAMGLLISIMSKE